MPLGGGPVPVHPVPIAAGHPTPLHPLHPIAVSATHRGARPTTSSKGVPLTFDFEWDQLPDDLAQRKQQAWQAWEAIDQQLHDPDHPLPPDELAELEQRRRTAWKQYWHADGARYHLSNRQMGEAITVMEHSGMARQVPTPPFPQPVQYGASSEEYGEWLDAADRGEDPHPGPALAGYLHALQEHLAANYDAEVIPRHKLWTNDGWLITPAELDAALPHAPTTALDRRQRPIPWWTQWLAYLDSGRGHGGVRVR